VRIGVVRIDPEIVVVPAGPPLMLLKAPLSLLDQRPIRLEDPFSFFGSTIRFAK
jgi:hypothetical protein